jgi:hypothetical protein
VTPIDPTLGFQFGLCGITGTTDCGYNITAPTNELSHLYYELGNVAFEDAIGVPQTNVGLINQGPFRNLLNHAAYWDDAALTSPYQDFTLNFWTD